MHVFCLWVYLLSHWSATSQSWSPYFGLTWEHETCFSHLLLPSPPLIFLSLSGLFLLLSAPPCEQHQPLKSLLVHQLPNLADLSPWETTAGCDGVICSRNISLSLCAIIFLSQSCPSLHISQTHTHTHWFTGEPLKRKPTLYFNFVQ